MYADDLVFLADNVLDLQLMLGIRNFLVISPEITDVIGFLETIDSRSKLTKLAIILH